MNVAVVLPELDPRSGGGFAFQQTLFETLLALEHETEHRLVYYVAKPANGAGGSMVAPRRENCASSAALVGVSRMRGAS